MQGWEREICSLSCSTIVPLSCVTFSVDFSSVAINFILQSSLHAIKHTLQSEYIETILSCQRSEWAKVYHNTMQYIQYILLKQDYKIYNWHSNKNTDGSVNRFASNMVILNQAHRVARLIGQWSRICSHLQSHYYRAAAASLVTC